MATLLISTNDIAAICSDAYSAHRYGKRNWQRAAELLHTHHHLQPNEIAAVLKSKHMRWAMDVMTDKFTADGFTSYMSKALTAKEIKGLVDGTI